MLATLLTIALLHWLLLIVPGPNVLLVSQLAASGNRASAFYAGIGISVIAAVWALLAIFGVNSLFALHPQLRIAVQIAGGLYLCYVAFKLWRASGVHEAWASKAFTSWAALRVGAITNITNPKTALFFGSVFSAALPAAPDTALLTAAVMLVFVNALSFHLLLALTLSHARVQTGYARQRRLLGRVCAAIVGAFGLRLLVATASNVNQN